MLAIREERGQGLAEYALLFAFVVIILIILVTIFGTQVGNLFSKITNKMP